MCPISITVSDLVQIDQELAEICRRHLEFSKSDIWTRDDTDIARIYKHTKFGLNQSRIGRDMPFCVFSKMAAAAILNFQKVTFWTLEETYIAGIYKHIKFLHIGQELAEIYPVVRFSRWRAPPS